MSRTETDPAEAERIRQWREGMVEWLAPTTRNMLALLYTDGADLQMTMSELFAQIKHVGLFKAAVEICWEKMQLAESQRKLTSRRNGQ